MKKGFKLLSFVTVGAFAISAFAMPLKVDFDVATGTTIFHAVGKPSAIKINGTGSAPKGKLVLNEDGKASGDLLFNLGSLDTGISTRNEHMKEKYLEVGKYPQAKLSFVEISLPKASFTKTEYTEEKVPFKGDLTLHGVTKPVSGTARVARAGTSSTVHAEFAIKISDYSIAVPKFAGITVADDVSLEIDAKAPITR